MAVLTHDECSQTVVLKEAIAGIGPHDRAYAADLR